MNIHLPAPFFLTLRNLRDLEGPQLLHVITRKGKGYAPAEADPVGPRARGGGRLPIPVDGPSHSGL